MNWKEFLIPDGKKIILFIIMILIAPFPYFVPSESDPGKIELKVIWGFPPLVFFTYKYLPDFLQYINSGIFQLTKAKTSFLFIPAYTFFIYILSCSINKNLDELKKKYGIRTFRGFLYRKLREEKRIKEAEEKIEEKEKKIMEEREKTLEELDEEKIEEKERLLKEQEELLKEEKEKLRQKIDEMNYDKLKGMGLDIKENLILCSNCKNWKSLTRDRVLKLVDKKGFEIIWKYRCKECKSRK